jgi:hypothetical protein
MKASAFHFWRVPRSRILSHGALCSPHQERVQVPLDIVHDVDPRCSPQTMLICSSSPLSFSDECVREAWAAFVPTGLVVVLLLVAALRIPLKSVWKSESPFADYLTLEQAEQLDADDDKIEKVDPPKPSRWFTLAVVILSLFLTGAWLAVGAYLLVLDKTNGQAILPFFFAFSWLYVIVKASVKPTIAPPYDLFMLFLVHFVGAVIMLGGILFDHALYKDDLPPRVQLVGLIVNVVVSFMLVVIIFSRPLAVPSARVPADDVGKRVTPEDYTTLWGWTTFHWVNPLVTKGTTETLNEEDVWNLSSTMKARPVFRKFDTIKGSSLTWRIAKANSQDIMYVTISNSIQFKRVFLS